jgi:hypothetical protein
MKILMLAALGSWALLAFTGCSTEYEVSVRNLSGGAPYYACVKYGPAPLALPIDMAFCTDMKVCNKICEDYRSGK